MSEIIEERVEIHSTTGPLEGVLAYPDNSVPDSTALFLSPHPHLGGNMDNNVILHLARRFAEQGHATLRFNYHGVGHSAIKLPDDLSLYGYWARLERERRYQELLPDAKSAYRFLQDAAPNAKERLVIGYSLGAFIAIMLAQSEGPTHLIGINPPIAKASLPSLPDTPIRMLFVGGDEDFAFDPQAFEERLRDLGDAVTLQSLPGCDHFLRQREETVYEALAAWLPSAS